MSDAQNNDKPESTWVKFDDEQGKNDPAVLSTESVEVTPGVSYPQYDSATSQASSENINQNNAAQRPEPLGNNESHQIEAPIKLNPSQLQNIPLNDTTQNRQDYSSPVIRQGFANGDVIVSILPQNASLPWITPATFRPELLPEELMAQGLTLTVEDYVHIMSQLVNDHRFTLYNICYKRILMAWITLAFVILLCILFAGFQHLAMFGAGIVWLMINAGAIFLCMWIKIKLNKNLERCLARINMQLLKHKILLGVDDRGKLSCHKINLCFIYFDPQECLNKLEQFIEQRENSLLSEENSHIRKLNEELDIEDPDIIITGTTNTRINRQQAQSALLYSRYSQRWAKEYLRKRLDWACDAAARLAGLSPPRSPRHLSTAMCPCQFIEEHLSAKELLNKKQPCCSCLVDFCQSIDL